LLGFPLVNRFRPVRRTSLKVQKVAFLGPQCSFSHDYARAKYGECNDLPCENFQEVLEAVQSSRADVCVLPLENSNASTIVQAQLELLRCRGRVFVQAIEPFHIRLDLYSFHQVSEINEVRSFLPVFAQTNDWLNRHLKHANRNQSFTSTSDAILSLQKRDSSQGCSAIGSQSADFYRVPRAAENIQTEPNYTVFATLAGKKSELPKLRWILLGVEKFSQGDIQYLTNILSDRGCVYNANWAIRKDSEAYGIFEIEAISGASVVDVAFEVENIFKKCFIFGGYSDKSITSVECMKHSI
jgi:prephenate dehydratase